MNTGKIISAFATIFIAFLSLIVWKMPESVVGELALIFVNNIVMSYGGLILFLFISNMAWFFLWKRQRDIYKKEIKRLSDIRSKLMHSPGGRVIENHRSTEGDHKETYLMPDIKKEKEKEKEEGKDE